MLPHRYLLTTSRSSPFRLQKTWQPAWKVVKVWYIMVSIAVVSLFMKTAPIVRYNWTHQNYMCWFLTYWPSTNERRFASCRWRSKTAIDWLPDSECLQALMLPQLLMVCLRFLGLKLWAFSLMICNTRLSDLFACRWRFALSDWPRSLKCNNIAITCSRKTQWAFFSLRSATKTICLLRLHARRFNLRQDDLAQCCWNRVSVNNWFLISFQQRFAVRWSMTQ